LETLAKLISIPTILFLAMPNLPAPTMAATGLCMLFTFACLCYAFARINRLPVLPWTVGGFFFGTFALGAIFYVIDRHSAQGKDGAAPERAHSADTDTPESVS
jgi:hypothetical protein